MYSVVEKGLATPHHSLSKHLSMTYSVLGPLLSARVSGTKQPLSLLAFLYRVTLSVTAGHGGCEMNPLPQFVCLSFFFLSSICKLIQSKRQLLKSRYFILMWVIPIISYIKISDFSCHPTGGRDVISDLFYRRMCICFYFVYGT